MTPHKNAATVAPGIFHIHYDFYGQVPGDFEEAICVLGFFASDFSEFPDGHRGPTRHFTFKTMREDLYHERWPRAVELGQSIGVPGYLEGERVFSDEVVEASTTFNESVATPFRLRRGPLTAKEGFRETEIHLTYCREDSDERVWRMMSACGMAIAVMPKHRRGRKYHRLILTAQGNVGIVRPLKSVLQGFFKHVGGIEGAAITEEMVLDHHLFGIVASDLPHVVREVRYA